MSRTEQSIDTLVSVSGTLASIGLALVAILSAKAAINHVATVADDIFLLASLGFLFVVVLGYLAKRNGADVRSSRLVTVADWAFSCSLAAIVTGAVLLVYTSF